MARVIPVTQMVHATAVAFGPRCVLLRGPSGSGKSDLALRLLTLTSGALEPLGVSWPGPTRLVSDDQVVLAVKSGTLTASAPKTIRGQLEVRGVGIVTLPAIAEAEVALVVDLVARERVPRLPDEYVGAVLLGTTVRRLQLAAFDDATPAKIMLALSRAG